MIISEFSLFGYSPKTSSPPQKLMLSQSSTAQPIHKPVMQLHSIEHEMYVLCCVALLSVTVHACTFRGSCDIN